jgi:SAM-dependent methyltransferase
LNYFDSRGAAQRYAKNRPYFHPLVIEKIKGFLGLTKPVPRALDVACGTGQSAVALKEISEEIVGVDASEEMLAQASGDDRISYVKAAAEDLPFPDAEFDLVTVASALHWFDRERFLAETARVLRPSGWLVVYDNRFAGSMKENPGYGKWVKEEYAERYPAPPRHSDPLTDADVRKHGLAFLGREEYTNEVSFSLQELTDYLMSQSNALAAIEEGRENEENARKWLMDAQASFFEGQRGTFLFEGSIDYLRRDGA